MFLIIETTSHYQLHTMDISCFKSNNKDLIQKQNKKKKLYTPYVLNRLLRSVTIALFTNTKNKQRSTTSAQMRLKPNERQNSLSLFSFDLSLIRMRLFIMKGITNQEQREHKFSIHFYVYNADVERKRVIERISVITVNIDGFIIYGLSFIRKQLCDYCAL